MTRWLSRVSTRFRIGIVRRYDESECLTSTLTSVLVICRTRYLRVPPYEPERLLSLVQSSCN